MTAFLWVLRVVLGVGTLVIGCVLAGVLYVLLPWLLWLARILLALAVLVVLTVTLAVVVGWALAEPGEIDDDDDEDEELALVLRAAWNEPGKVVTYDRERGLRVHEDEEGRDVDP